MGFLKQLFGGAEPSEEDKRKEALRQFDKLKYDGIAALRTNQPKAAVPRLKAALDIQDDMECRDYLSQALMAAREFEQALQVTEELCTLVPDNIDLWLRLAHICYVREDYDGVLTAAGKAAELAPDNASAYFYLGRGQHGKANDIMAVAMLTKCITLAPNFGSAYILRGNILLKMGSVEEATHDADFLMKHLPDNEDVLLLKAHTHEAKDETAQAMVIYNKVIEQNPFCSAAFMARGALRMKIGDSLGAEDDMKTLMEIDPDLIGNLTGKFSTAEPEQDIEQKVLQAYKNIDPYGIFS